LVAVAVEAERLGYDAISLPDHVVFPARLSTPYPYTADGAPPWSPEDEWADPLVAAAAMAARTARIEFVTGVYVLAMRHPLLVAKALATLGEVSDGRFSLGVGAGWMREEFAAVDAPFAGRGRRLDESIDVLRAALAGPTSYAGRHFAFDELSMSPRRPVRILAGGHSPAALRRAARLDGLILPLTSAAQTASYVREVRRLRESDAPFEIIASGFDAVELEAAGVDAVRVHPFSFYAGGAQNPGALSLEQRFEFMARYMDEVIRP
jgi:probable F420-dependent oxidoreductase